MAQPLSVPVETGLFTRPGDWTSREAVGVECALGAFPHNAVLPATQTSSTRRLA
jgi:hypothetical protein